MQSVTSNAVAASISDIDNYKQFCFSKYTGNASITLTLPTYFDNIRSFMIFCQGSYTGRVAGVNIYKNSGNWSIYTLVGGLSVSYNGSTRVVTINSGDANPIGTLNGFIIPTPKIVSL